MSAGARVAKQASLHKTSAGTRRTYDSANRQPNKGLPRNSAGSAREEDHVHFHCLIDEHNVWIIEVIKAARAAGHEPKWLNHSLS